MLAWNNFKGESFGEFQATPWKIRSTRVYLHLSKQKHRTVLFGGGAGFRTKLALFRIFVNAAVFPLEKQISAEIFTFGPPPRGTATSKIYTYIVHAPDASVYKENTAARAARSDPIQSADDLCVNKS